MQKQLLCVGLVMAWLHASAGVAQFGQNPQLQNNPPANSHFLPRVGGPKLNSQQFYPYGYGSPLNNNYNFNNAAGFGGWNPYTNTAFGGGAGGWNPYTGTAFGGNGNPWNSPYGNPWQGNPWGGGTFNNPWQTPWGFGNIYSNSAPFGGYQYYGYGNFAPIVGLNNGWWPYQPAYNYNNPVNQYLQNLYMQGLPNLNNLPGGNGGILPR